MKKIIVKLVIALAIAKLFVLYTGLFTSQTFYSHLELENAKFGLPYPYIYQNINADPVEYPYKSLMKIPLEHPTKYDFKMYILDLFIVTICAYLLLEIGSRLNKKNRTKKLKK